MACSASAIGTLASGIRARYVVERHEIEKRYREWEIIDEPERREVPDDPSLGIRGLD